MRQKISHRADGYMMKMQSDKLTVRAIIVVPLIICTVRCTDPYLYNDIYHDGAGHITVIYYIM